MSKRKQDKGRQQPWISVYRHTWKSAAWKVLSVGAKALYVELTANYNTKMQNSVFMSARTGSERLNVDKDCITKWLRELEHYGFIVKVSGPFLGSDGEAKSAHYGLTDRWYAGKEPTYNFQNWTGEIFDPKKQNPVRKNRTPRPEKPDIGDGSRIGQNGNKRPEKPDIGGHADCPEKRRGTAAACAAGLDDTDPDRDRVDRGDAEAVPVRGARGSIMSEIHEIATRLLRHWRITGNGIPSPRLA